MIELNSEFVEVMESDRIAFSHHVFISLKHRFIFFTIPKVACTRWIQLFLRLEGDDHWMANPHFNKSNPYLSRHSCDEIESYLNNPDWTKAVFFRDPVERLLSAYLNKIQNGSYITRRLFNAGGGEISFRQFVEIVSSQNKNIQNPQGLHKKTDPHWKPQYLTSNIEKYVSCLNFIGDFSNLENDSRKLLKKIGLWNDYASSGWGVNKDQEMFEINDASNKTNANDRLHEFYNGDLFAVVKNAYMKDYLLLSEVGINRDTK